MVIKKLSLAQFFLAFLFLTLTACRNKLPEQKEIIIGLIAPLTGEQKESTGQPTLQAANLAVKQINDAGGIQLNNEKYQVRLLLGDDQDIPDQGVSAARQLIYQNNVVAIIGVPLSRIAIPVAKIADQAKVPLIASTSTNPETTKDKKYAFRACFIDTLQGQEMAKFVRENLQLKRAAILYDIANPYSKSLSHIFQQVFEEIGGKIVVLETYTSDANVDFNKQVNRLFDQNPDVIFLPNYTTDLVRQVKQIREKGIDAIIVGGDSWTDLESKDWSMFNHSFYSSYWYPNPQNQKVQNFVKTYQKTYQQNPDADAALTYDAFQMLFQAIRTQGKADPESIRQGLNNLTFDGVTGMAKFNGTGDPQKSLIVMEIKNGKSMFYQQIDP